VRPIKRRKDCKIVLPFTGIFTCGRTPVDGERSHCNNWSVICVMIIAPRSTQEWGAAAGSHPHAIPWVRSEAPPLALGGYGMSAIAALTAQNTLGVEARGAPARPRWWWIPSRHPCIGEVRFERRFRMLEKKWHFANPCFPRFPRSGISNNVLGDHSATHPTIPLPPLCGRGPPPSASTRCPWTSWSCRSTLSCPTSGCVGPAPASCPRPRRAPWWVSNPHGA